MTIADPFLLAHQAGPRTFDLSGKLWPVSIRDQMVRGRLLVDRMFDQGILVTDPADIDSRLLVIGAGACGATAAAHAAVRGATVLLIDKEKDRFGFQLKAPSRWVDPAQYDWPLDHWTGTTFPWAGSAMPLTWSAGPAPAVAAQWENDLRAALAVAAGRLTILMRAGLSGPLALLPDKVHVHLAVQGRPCPEPMEFGRVIVAVGPGQEKTAVPWPAVTGGYVGFEFWEHDPFEDRPWKHTAPRTDALISGAGDGALQDFLRLMTGEPSAKLVSSRCGLPAWVARDLGSAEAVARSALHWGTNGEYDHLIHMQLDAEHRAVARRALGLPAVVAALDGMLSARAPDGMALVFPCRHLMCMYGLNRFLVHLIIERFKMLPPAPPARWPSLDVLDGSSVTAVTAHPGSPHACGTASACFGQGHEVTLVDAPVCYRRTQPTRRWTRDANVVVIRHGLEERDIRNLGLVPQLRARQVLPYYLP
jgi:hypothetical protein